MNQVHNLKRGRRPSGGSPIIRKLKKFSSSFSIKIPAADDEDAYQSHLNSPFASPRTPRATDSPIMRGMKTLARRIHVSKWRLSFADGMAVPTQSGLPAKVRKEWKRAPCSMSGPLAPRDEAVAFNWNDACSAQQVPFGDADEECDGFVARTRRGSSAAVAVGVAGLCALAEVAGSPFRAQPPTNSSLVN